ncbi:energy transducer TonB [Novosphingobium sp. EMRT-2]|uniref:energy transducer TonB n=1 Tax=Novosphingobium sp. EMRT-2 TaxID=2571749 RepID=UPI00143DE65A|nr:energy transducer TonB [Novosphingobium sp. EMRT-2]
MVHVDERGSWRTGAALRMTAGRLGEGRLGGRLGTAAAVTALHVGIGMALLSTFAGGVIVETVRDALPTMWFAPPVPPPKPLPTVEPKTTHDEQEIKIPDKEIDLNPGKDLLLGTNDKVTPADPGTLTIGGGDLGGDIGGLGPSPTPSPTFTPQAARPRGDAGLWITRNDYPTRAIRENWEGLTRLRLGIGTDGRVTGCEVIRSSGHDELDRAACAKVSARARFDPATDKDGAKTAGSFTTAIRWQITD